MTAIFAADREAFFAACLAGDVKLVRTLLDNGFRPNRGDDDLYTALHRLTEVFRPKVHGAVAQLLVERGADVNADHPATDGWTPLHLAAWSGNAEAVRFLLLNNADASLGDWYGQTPLQVAQYAGHHEAADALRHFAGLRPNASKL